MKKKLEEIKKKALPVLKEAGVLRGAFFGSYVRGEQTNKSDIDILVELPKGSSLFDLIGLEQRLEEVLKNKVDLVTYKSVSPRIKDYIEKDQLPIL